MLAKKMQEMIERRRARYETWAKEFGFPPPPKTGGWDELREYANDNREAIQRADILSEMKWIDEQYGRT